MLAKSFLILISISFCFVAFTQDDELLEWSLEIDSAVMAGTICETFENMANRDIGNGYYVCFISGYRFNNSETFERLMLRKYGVYAVLTGSCSRGEIDDCYNSVSIPAIKKKLGENIFKNTMQEADSLDRIGKGDRETYFAGGWKEFKKIIYSEFDSNIIRQYGPKDNFPSPTVSLHVDESGKIFDCGIRYCENQIVIDEINRIIPNLPRMVYATKDGIAVKDSLVFGLPINRKAKRKNKP